MAKKKKRINKNLGKLHNLAFPLHESEMGVTFDRPEICGYNEDPSGDKFGKVHATMTLSSGHIINLTILVYEYGYNFINHHNEVVPLNTRTLYQHIGMVMADC